jgi:nitrogen fixation NifU-like protein
MESDIDSLYRELVLDHARQPRNFRVPEVKTHEAEGINTVCGDHVFLFLAIENNRVTDAAFHGTGCAICLASASLLTEEVCGLSVDQVLVKSAELREDLQTQDGTHDLGRLEALRGVKRYPSRVQCATLAWRALSDAIGTDYI